jgi:hypothetical protein
MHRRWKARDAALDRRSRARMLFGRGLRRSGIVLSDFCEPMLHWLLEHLLTVITVSDFIHAGSARRLHGDIRARAASR